MLFVKHCNIFLRVHTSHSITIYLKHFFFFFFIYCFHPLWERFRDWSSGECSRHCCHMMGHESYAILQLIIRRTRTYTKMVCIQGISKHVHISLHVLCIIIWAISFSLSSVAEVSLFLVPPSLSWISKSPNRYKETYTYILFSCSSLIARWQAQVMSSIA